MVQLKLQLFGDGLENSGHYFDHSITEAQKTALHVLKVVLKSTLKHIEELDLRLHDRDPPEVLLKKQQKSQ
jgi:hypothetical protein